MPSIPSALSARFKIGSELWSGSSGVLYEATEVSTSRSGVLKIVSQAASWTPAERGRLARELEKQATLNHPYLATPIAAGIAEDVPWIFRTKIEGESLAARIARGPLAVGDAVAIAAQLASGLDELHRAGLLQRDLSPGHIILQTNGSIPFVRVIDSGVATRIPSSAIFEVTGKPPYVSPEHAAGKLVSFRSDLYALGSMLFEMLTGQPLFSGTTEQVLEAQRSTAAPSLASVAPALTVPGAITTLLGQLLAKEPRERPFSAQQVRRTLEPLVPEGGLAHAQAPAPGAGAMKKTLLGVPSPTMKRPDATEELSALDLQQAAAVLRPPMPTRKDETMPLQALDLLPAIAPPRSVPPPAPGISVPPRPSAPPPPPSASKPPPPPDARTGSGEMKRVSLPPPVPPAARPSSSGTLPGLSVPPAPTSSAGMVPSASASSPGGLAIPPAPPPPAPPAPVMAAPVMAAPAGDLDYDDLAETNAVSREEFEQRQVTHQVAAINDLAPAAAVPPGAMGYAPQAQTQPGYHQPPAYNQGFGASAPSGSGAPSPFGGTQMMPQTGMPMGQQQPYGQPQPYGQQAYGQPQQMPGTQMMPMGGTPQQRPPAGMSQPISADDVPGMRRSRSPFIILAVVVGACFMFSLAGFGAYVLIFGPATTPAVAMTPTIVPTPGPIAMQPMIPTVATPPVSIAPLPPPPSVAAIQPLPPVSVAVAVAPPPPSVAPEPTPLVAIADPTRDAPPSHTGSRSGHAGARPIPSTPPPPTTAPRGGMLASRIGPSTSPTPPPAPAPAAGSGRLASRLGSAAPAPSGGSASGGSFDDLRARARTAFSAHHYDDAASAYEQASRLQPTNAGVFAGLGAARLAGGHAAQAVTAYQRAVQLQPTSAGYHAALGRAYATAGDRGHARSEYDAALRIDPDNRDARTGIAHL